MKKSASKAKIDWAKKLLRRLDQMKSKLREDERATAAYWNCDEWGSISGVRDAVNWVENELAKYLLKYARQKSPTRRSSSETEAAMYVMTTRYGCGHYRTCLKPKPGITLGKYGGPRCPRCKATN